MYCQANFVDDEYANKLVAEIDLLPWSNTLQRRTQHYGYEYNYKTKGIGPAPPISGNLLHLANHIASCGIMVPEQCIVNEYRNGQGISPHTDSNVFGNVIVTISLLADCTIRFEKGDSISDIVLTKNSMLVMKDDYRYNYKHSIKIRRESDSYRRISITYRSLQI